MQNGWDTSADAWIQVIGERGDWGRRHVLDAPMLERAGIQPAAVAVDIGCGEGRFCRMLQQLGLATIGIDPAQKLVDAARARDPAGDYRIGQAEKLALPDACCDLAVCYLSLIDVADLAAALAEIARILRPGGRLLIANLQGFNTAAVGNGWSREPDGSRRFMIDHYLQERCVRIAWSGISIDNWHRPLSAYMAGLLAQGLELRYFAEPGPTGCDSDKADRYRRVPNFLIMEWQKSG